MGRIKRWEMRTVEYPEGALLNILQKKEWNSQ
jgi:hypothetical protein